LITMQVDEKLVDDLAHLSRLQFNPGEKESIRKDMEKIIGFVEKLNELDTTGVQPLRHMSEVMNVMRADEVQGSVDRETALSNAALNDGTFIKVPKVISR
jgi:aspartyl-tRNA(Asn)/glutamyl-tRNA(Gln) amidotransferase subunit C